MSNEKWPWWVARKYAEEDGRRPDEFDHWQWPVSDVRLEWPQDTWGDAPFRYRCAIPASTPHANQYDQAGNKLPDPTGLALSWVRFELRAVDDDEVLEQQASDHVDGAVAAHGGHRGVALWRRLVPGASIKVRLYAIPLFYYLEGGAAMLSYANTGHRGYFGGTEEESPVYTLSLTENHVLLLDGKEAPPPPEGEQAPLTPEEIELQAQEERERAEYERERREIAERERKQREEIEAAKRFIYDRRTDYRSTEDWLLGVLFDKSIDFTLRKRVYLVADEVKFDIEAARKRRNAERERKAAERKRRYEEEQARQRAKDDIEMVTQAFEYMGHDTLDAKAGFLRQLYHNPQYDRFDRAVEIIAKDLGVTL